MSDNEEEQKRAPPPPKPLPFSPPKPPVLHPTIGAPAPIDINAFKSLPNPFTPKPKSVSPIPTISPVPKESPIPKVSPIAPSQGIGVTVDPNIHVDIPITPVVEEEKHITSPAYVEVSEHKESNEKQPVIIDNNRIDMSGGLMGWLTKSIGESKLLNDIGGKAKAGMETVMTTLDPGMKPFLSEHGVIEVTIINGDSDTITVATDAFTKAGGMSICNGMATENDGGPVLVFGEELAMKWCKKRMENGLKMVKQEEGRPIVVVVMQPFVLKIGGRYYSTCKVLIHDGGFECDAIGQMLEVSKEIFEVVEKSCTKGESTQSISQSIKKLHNITNLSWDAHSSIYPPYDSKNLLFYAFLSLAQQLLIHLDPRISK